MPSPFPGMNPYLEQPDVWPDFHNRYMIRMAEAVTKQVRPRYIVRADTRVTIDPEVLEPPMPRDRRQDRRPDVAVLRNAPAGHAVDAGGGEGGGGGTAVAEPRAKADLETETATAVAPVETTIPDVEPWEQVYLEVRRLSDRLLVTVIELLSPTNKAGPSRQDYLDKRRKYFDGGVNLVEIDLLRLAGPMPMGEIPRSSYRILVARAAELPAARVWAVGLHKALPKIPIPLLPPDADAELDLQPLLHETYDAAGYADYIYEGEPAPPIFGEDGQWIRRQAGLPDPAAD